MTLIEKISGIWREDNLLRRVVKHSSYLFSSNVASSILSFIQTIIALRLIGMENWGLISTIQVFASNVNRFLSFRMYEVMLKYFGGALAENKKREAAVVVKAIGLTEAVTSILAFLVLLVLAPWASKTFGKNVHTEPLFIFYGSILLTNLVFETCTGVLQATHRFNHIARANLIQSIITVSIIGSTYILFRLDNSLMAPFVLKAILLAYVLGKTYVAISYLIVALKELNQNLEPGWWRVSFRELRNKRALAAFAVNTNLNGTVNLIFRDNIQLYLAALLSLTDAGYYKTAMTFILPLTYILDPFIFPTYAEISRTIARLEWETTLRLLRRITAIAAGIVAAYLAGWAIVGQWLIPFLYKSQAKPVYPILLILIIGYGFAGIFSWNRSLFLSLGKPGYPILVTTLMGVIELGLMAYLVPAGGRLVLTAIFAGYLIAASGFISLRGIWAIHRRQRQETAPA